MSDSRLVVPLVIGIIFLVICAVLSYTTFGYIEASSCADTDADAQQAKQYALYYGIATTVIFVGLLAGLGYILYKKYYRKSLGTVGLPGETPKKSASRKEARRQSEFVDLP